MTCAILAVAKDEDKYLNEWIDYHLMLGFDHIYICDNNSSDTPIILDNDRGHKITIFPYHNIDFSKNFSSNQENCYNYHLEKLWDKYDYCAIIDIDEFFEFRDCSNVKEFIQKHIIDLNHTVAEIPWEVYSDNDLIYSQESYPVLKTYIKISDKLPFSWGNNINSWGKSIFKLNKGITTTPHWPNSASMTKFDTNHVLSDIAVVKHYRTKSLEEFLNHKVKNRAFSVSPQSDGGNIIKTYFTINDVTVEKLLYILDYYHNNSCIFTSEDKLFIKDCFDKLGFITVVIRTHNRLSFLKDCIKSVENQTKLPDILVLDDGSYPEVFEWCSKKSINYVRSHKNVGSSEILMRGRHLIQTPYYIILDDDDFWTRLTVIEEFYDLILNNPGYDIYGNNYFHTGSLVKTKLLLDCPMVSLSGLGEDWYFCWIKKYGKLCPVNIPFSFYHYRRSHNENQLSNIHLDGSISRIVSDYYNQQNYPQIIKNIEKIYYTTSPKERKILDQIKQYINNKSLDS